MGIIHEQQPQNEGAAQQPEAEGPKLAPGLAMAIQHAGDAALRRMLHEGAGGAAADGEKPEAKEDLEAAIGSAPAVQAPPDHDHQHLGKTKRIDIGGTGHTDGMGYENSLQSYHAAGDTAAVAAQKMLAKHKGQPTIILNEISISLTNKKGHDGYVYRVWVVHLAKALAGAGKQVIIASALNSQPLCLELFKTLGHIPGVRLAMETQVTGHDNPATIHDKLAKTLRILGKLGIPPHQIIHVANLAHSAKGKGFGSDGESEKKFDANVKDEVHEAAKLGYGAVMGYGFKEQAQTISAWNQAWESAK
jgi:hypothetical protein